MCSVELELYWSVKKITFEENNDVKSSTLGEKTVLLPIYSLNKEVAQLYFAHI